MSSFKPERSSRAGRREDCSLLSHAHRTFFIFFGRYRNENFACVCSSEWMLTFPSESCTTGASEALRQSLQLLLQKRADAVFSQINLRHAHVQHASHLTHRPSLEHIKVE